jgi:hypothetical protein
MIAKSGRTLTQQPSWKSRIHHRDAEHAEFGVFFDQKTLVSAPSAPPRLNILDRPAGKRQAVQNQQDDRA